MKFSLSLFAILASLISLQAQRTVIYCGQLIDVEKREMQKEMTIIVEKGNIVDVLKGYATTLKDDKVLDLKSRTVMPGLIDMHVHVESETKKGGAIERFVLNPADIALESLRYLNVTLMAGFTTVRDLGGTGVNVALRNAVSKNWIVGPRIFTSGKSIATTGGHADPSNGYRKELMGNPGPNEGVINGPAEAIQAVRQRYKDGAGFN
jgi:imidazolonepropionase-like amidohydrolase